MDSILDLEALASGSLYFYKHLEMILINLIGPLSNWVLVSIISPKFTHNTAFRQMLIKYICGFVDSSTMISSSSI